MLAITLGVAVLVDLLVVSAFILLALAAAIVASAETYRNWTRAIERERGKQAK